MTEDELVDQLARRLWSVYWQGGGDDQHGPGGDNENVEPWRLTARECLRQMQWAHSEGLGYSAGGPMEFPGLAPPEWTP